MLRFVSMKLLSFGKNNYFQSCKSPQDKIQVKMFKFQVSKGGGMQLIAACFTPCVLSIRSAANNIVQKQIELQTVSNQTIHSASTREEVAVKVETNQRQCSKCNEYWPSRFKGCPICLVTFPEIVITSQKTPTYYAIKQQQHECQYNLCFTIIVFLFVKNYGRRKSFKKFPSVLKVKSLQLSTCAKFSKNAWSDKKSILMITLVRWWQSLSRMQRHT